MAISMAFAVTTASAATAVPDDWNATYNSFAELSDPVEEPKTGEIGETWSKVGENVTLTTPENALALATYTAAEETSIDTLVDEAGAPLGSYISVPLVDYVPSSANGFISIKYVATGIDYIGMHISGTKDEAAATNYVAQLYTAGWNVTNIAYPEFSVVTANISSYCEGFTALDALIIKVQGQAGATLKIIEMQITNNGEHTMEVPLGELSISDLVVPEGVTYAKDEATGYQTVSYDATTAPGWSTIDANVTNYDKNSGKTILELVVNATDSVGICFEINGNIDWSLGHKLYAGGKDVTITLDISESGAYNGLPKNFVIRMYLDAENTVAEAKSVIFKSITIKEPAPPRTDTYLGEPTSSGMNCVESAAGYDISYTNEEGVDSWRNVGIAINNYTTDYDIIVINMNAKAGMNMGVRLCYMIELDGELVESHQEIRNHWDNEEGIFETDGQVSLVFFMEAYELKGFMLTKIELYFDPPTGNYTPVAGEITTTISSIDLLKSSEQDFEELNITAEDATLIFTGEPAAYVATNDQDVELKYSYMKAADEKAEWHDGLPTTAGVYTVKVEYMGSLAYAYTSKTATLTINKAQAVLEDGAVSVDAETRIVTVAEGVIASKDADFTEGFEVVNGDEIAYGTVIYYMIAENENYLASEVKSLTFSRPAEPENPGNSGSGNNAGTTDKSGCGSSMGAGAYVAVIAIMAASALMFVRRKQTNN